MSGTLHHTTRTHAAYETQDDGIKPGWLLLVACLFVTALAALTVRPVCVVDVPGARESAAGVRHMKRDGRWYHCEPWLIGVVRD